MNGALAFNRYLGMQIMLGVSGDQTTYRPRLYDPTLGTAVGHDQTVSTFQGDGAIALDFDASPLGVPLDVMAEYALGLLQSSQSQRASSITGSTAQHLVALGLYYSGRADFQLGMVGYTLLGQLPVVGADGTVSGKPQDGGVQLVFHYIW